MKLVRLVSVYLYTLLSPCPIQMAEAKRDTRCSSSTADLSLRCRQPPPMSVVYTADTADNTVQCSLPTTRRRLRRRKTTIPPHRYRRAREQRYTKQAQGDDREPSRRREQTVAEMVDVPVARSYRFLDQL